MWSLVSDCLHAVVAGFAERDLWNVRGDGSIPALMLAARITLAHFSVSSAMSLPKSAGEPAMRPPPKVGKPRPHLGIGEARVDLLVELVDDLGRRVPGRADAEPSARLVARHEIAHGRNVGQRFRARRRGYR